MSKKNLPAERGRPSKYDPVYVVQAERLCQLGATNQDIADFYEVSVRTIERWAARWPDFCRALKVGKSVADDRVERSLYERALGWSCQEDKIFMVDGKAKVVSTVKRYPPDTTAMIFWLKNRRPGSWRDRQEFGIGRLDDLTDEQLDERVNELIEKAREK